MMKKDCDNKVIMQMRVSGQFHFFYEEILHAKKSQNTNK